MSTAPMPYGTWPSPIAAADLATGTLDLSEVACGDGADWWLEARPTEGGRVVLVRRDPGADPVDAVPADFNVRTLVHEYGGGSYALHGGTVFAARFDDQRWYRIDPGGDPVPITPEPDRPRAVRFADAVVSPDGARLYAVREVHHADGAVDNDLVVLPTDGSAEPVRIAGGRDFYAAPRLSPDGRLLAFVAWDHPDMPWDATTLHEVPLGDDGLPAEEPAVVDGGPGVSVYAPGYDHEGRLLAVADPEGWWNLHRYFRGTRTNLTPMAAEVGGPPWMFRTEPFAVLDDGRIVMVVGEGGVQQLVVREPEGRRRVLDVPFTAYRGASLAVAGTRILVAAAGPSEVLQVVAIDADSGDLEVLRRATEPPPEEVIPPAEPITFTTEEGQTAHAVHYAPRNGDLTAPEGERPPLIVMSHGGPTAQALPQLANAIAFWTSRGFAVVDVNYGGSTGFGRAYRERLKGRWGDVDVADCVAAAQHLAERGLVDGDRMVIRGGSAGGYTTLRALTSTDVFAAGASYFGVADLGALARDTHKFESRYLDGLVGRWPEDEAEYWERSPLAHLDELSCPVLVLQGLEDEVVPPSQAEAIVAALAAKGIPHAYLPFEGEQHGFRKASSIQRALEAELSFYGQVLGFEPADDLPPLELEGGRPDADEGGVGSVAGPGANT